MPGNALPHGAAPGARRSPPALGSALVRTSRLHGIPHKVVGRHHKPRVTLAGRLGDRPPP